MADATFAAPITLPANPTSAMHAATKQYVDTKAPLASPTFTGTVTLPSTTSIGNVSSTELGYLDGVTSAIQTQLSGKANTSHTHAISDVTSLQTSLDAKAPIASPTFTGKVTLPASVAGSAPLNIPQGTAPSSPANGDIWTTSVGVYARINGTTYGPFGTVAGNAVWGAITGSVNTQQFKIGSSPAGWTEGVVVVPNADNGYALTFYRKLTNAASTNTWAIGKEGTTNNFIVLREGLTGMSGTARADAPLHINTSGKMYVGAAPRVYAAVELMPDGNGYDSINHLNSSGVRRWSLGLEGNGNYSLRNFNSSGGLIHSAWWVDQPTGDFYTVRDVRAAGWVYTTNVQTAGINNTGGTYFLDSGTPTVDAGQGSGRFLFYQNDGRLRRADAAGYRTLIGCTSSSVRFKDDIAEARPDEIPDVTLLKPATFRWKNETYATSADELGKPQLGLIAEDVAEVDPRFIRSSEGEAQGINTNAVLAALIAKVTELQARIDELEQA